MDVRIEQAAAATTYALRESVLRPGATVAELDYPGDRDPATLHLAAWAPDVDGPAGVASIYREAPPWGDTPPPGADPAAPAWRLRGMATAPQARGRGIGRLLLEGCFEHLASQGGGLLWCNARTPAVGFYERLGMRVTGDEFTIGTIGPHFVMWRMVTPPAPGA